MSVTIQMLIRRGFLIEEDNNGFLLSDNAHPNDREYLISVLKKYRIGRMEDNRIVFECDLHQSNGLEEMFVKTPTGSTGVGSLNQQRSWTTVKNRYYAEKIPTKWLEANIAYYIKALSACGIYTGGCCDGNHENSSLLYIEFDGPIYGAFHKLIWETQLNDLFTVNWNERYDGVVLDERQKQYDELYLAGKYLYENRLHYQSIRMEAAKWINKNVIKKNDRIAERFLKDAEEILKEKKWK